MAARDAILDLIQPEISPFDPPSPKTWNETRSGSDDALPRYGHLKKKQMRRTPFLALYTSSFTGNGSKQ